MTEPDPNSDHEMEGTDSTPAQAPQTSTTDLAALAAGWLDGSITSAVAITNPRHPFYVQSTNGAGFKYKYPEAAPTPPGEDDAVWNKTYTAADSRMYNKNGKDANQSRKFRISKETYTLTLRIHLENKQKHAKKFGGAFAIPTTNSSTPSFASSTPKPKAPSTGTGSRLLNSLATDRNDTAGVDISSMSISEKIKSEGRSRKTNNSFTADIADTSSSFASMPSKDTTPGPKTDKPVIKRKGTATTVKKPANKKAKPAPGVSTDAHTTPTIKPPRASDSESNDGGEYCICRGPDDHRMMVYCDGGCEDWYHCSCMGVDEDDAKELLDQFTCPKCEREDKITTWKRMCRYNSVDPTHRKAARVNEESKYCSKECGFAFMSYVLKKGLRSDDEPSMGGVLNMEEAASLLKSAKDHKGLQALGQKPRLRLEDLPADDLPGNLPFGWLDKLKITSAPIGLKYLTAEERKELDDIEQDLKKLNDDIAAYEDQAKLLDMVVARGTAAIKLANINVRAVCTYDNRLCFNESQFAKYMQTNEAKQAFATGKLGPRTEESMDIDGTIPHAGQNIPSAPVVRDELQNICLRTGKCCHGAWQAILADDYKYMQAQCKRKIMKLRTRENEIIEDAETREATKSYDDHNVTIKLF